LTDGILLAAQPPGLTSFQALSAIKRTLGTRRVGHTGTLDRFASGLLVVTCGRATRLGVLVEGLDKEYVARVRFGTATDTLDPDGAVVAEGFVPDRTAVEAALPAFRGEIMQAPPAYSAVHVGGRRAHELARSGRPIEPAARPVRIARLELVSWESPHAVLTVVCSRGTYLRSLARALAARQGTGAPLAQLRRTRVGGLRVEEAVAPGEFVPSRALLRAWALFDRCPSLGRLELDELAARKLAAGAPPEDSWFPGRPLADGIYGAFRRDEELVALVERVNGRWRGRAVFAGAVA